MVEKVNPSINRPIAAFKTAGAIALAGGSSEGWISRVGQATDISVEDADITAANLDAFEETSSGSSLSVTIAGGEAFVYGAWLAKDDSTTVSLAPSTSGQTVYVGWNKGGTDDVIIGLDAAFSDASGDTDEKLPLFTYDTDGSGVTAVTDERQLGKYVPADSIDAARELNIPVYSDSSNASDELGNLIYIDGGGTQPEGIYTYNGTEYVKSGQITVGSGIEQTNNTISHSDTSTQSDLSSSDGSAIVDLTFDDFGHVTEASTDSFDGRYLNSSGDTLGGALDLSGNSITDTSQNYLDFTGDSNSIRISTGETIQDSAGTNRYEIAGSATRVNTDLGRSGITLSDGFNIRHDAYADTPIVVKDQEGGFNAIRYNTSNSTPGELELSNAKLTLLNESMFNEPYDSYQLINGIEQTASSGVKLAADPGYNTSGEFNFDNIAGRRDNGDVGGYRQKTTFNTNTLNTTWELLSIEKNGGTGGPYMRVSVPIEDSSFGTVEIPNSDFTLPNALFAESSTGNLEIAGQLTENASI